MLAFYKHRLGHLLADAHNRVKAGQRVLEYHRYLVAAKLAELLLGDLHKVLPVVQYLAALFYRVVGEYAEHRARRDGLARAGLADYGERLALVEVERNIAHRLDLASVRAERYAKIFYRKLDFSVIHISPPCP